MGLGGRLSLAFAAVVAVTALLIGGASSVTTGRQVSQETDQFLTVRAGEIAEGQRPTPRSRDGRSRDNGAQALAVEPDANVSLLSEDGVVEAAFGVDLPVSEQDLVIADDPSAALLQTVTIDGTDYRMITRHIEGGGAVRVARSLDETNSLLGMLQTRLLVIAGGMAVVGALVGWALARRITKPLRSLTTAVDSVAETQDFTVPVAGRGSDEVGRLARGFDRMLTALDVSREQQGRLVQDAAHELRTPLTSIKANVDWLSRAESVDAATRTETLAGVQQELRDLNGVIQEIIDLATDRHELPPFQPVDLAEVAATAVTRFGTRSSRRVTLRSVPTPIDGDPEALGRAIANLLSNADKYSPPQAPILVDVHDGGLWVSDEGQGIPTADRAKVFDRFFRRQENRAQPGSGLGLSIVAGIVDGHGGRVQITDAPGGGARVGFQLVAAPVG